jgi:hypothetical protein
MVQIASETEAASKSVSEIKTISLNQGTQVTLSKSNISSMTIGTEINNQLLTDLSQLINCVKEQSQQFPKIAELIAIEDSKINF